jgi:hypothetical protein
MRSPIDGYGLMMMMASDDDGDDGISMTMNFAKKIMVDRSSQVSCSVRYLGLVCFFEVGVLVLFLGDQAGDRAGTFTVTVVALCPGPCARRRGVRENA